MLKSNRGRSQHIVDIVFAEKWNLHGLPNLIADQIEARTFATEHLSVFGSNVCRWLQPKKNNPPIKVAAELAHIFIIGIQHRKAAVGQSLDQLVFGASNSGK